MAKIDAQGNDLEKDRVFLIREGLLMAWFCAPKSMTIEQVQESADAHCRRPGTRTNRWEIQKDLDNEREDLRSPGRCDEGCGRQHWKAVC